MSVISLSEWRDRREGVELEELIRDIDHRPVCVTCGESVPFEGLRAHLATHRADASTLETEEVWDCYRVGP